MSTLRQGSREVRRLHRAGLGLRRSLLADTLQGLQRGELGEVAFFEVAPENWSRLGGRFSRDLSAISEFRPLACHGLSLNLGGSDGLDMQLLADLPSVASVNAMPTPWCSLRNHMPFSFHCRAPRGRGTSTGWSPQW